MINDLLPKYLMMMVLVLAASCSSGQPGCTDPMAFNYDPEASEDDRSCLYQVPSIEPDWTLDLAPQISETSGLILWDGALWTHNDDTDTRLYLLDPSTGEVIGGYTLPGVVNQDWEEIAQDDEFIYVGDIGNNRGERDNLHILRVEKASLKSDSPSIDTIWFTYSDQQNLASEGLNQTEFDCEAFIVTKDSIYLFTKQWISAHTTQYALPKLPGTYVARKGASFNIHGQVTGASYIEKEGLLVLCGYSGLAQPFLHLFYGYGGDEFFAGKEMRVNLLLPLHQVEAVHTSDGIQCYVTNERVSSYVNIPQRLHLFNLGEIPRE